MGRELEFEWAGLLFDLLFNLLLLRDSKTSALYVKTY